VSGRQARSSATYVGRRVASDDPLEDLNLRPTYRTARVLTVIAAQPGLSNRDVSGWAGIEHALARL
jgi:hypothetical protein